MPIEPTTALDVTIQAQILDLLESINQRLGTATILISHNMGVVGRLCPRALVMYAGKIVEEGPTDQLFRAPTHPYTWGLLQAIPRLDNPRDERLFSIPGRPPDPLHRPQGCPFVDRCTFSIGRCHSEMPALVELAPRQRSACWVTQAGATLPRLDSPIPRASLGIPARQRPASNSHSDPLLELQNVTKYFPTGGHLFRRAGNRDVIHAVEGVSLSVYPGETVGLVGESGCGKSTLGRTVVHAFRPTSGSIRINGVDTAQMTEREFRPLRRQVQMIFQDPYASLNPRMTVEQIIGEPLKVHRLADRARFGARIDELLETVGLTPRARPRYPHEFSGGQRQRIAVARALAVDPALIVCDEPVSSLDVSLQAQVVNLLKELQIELGVAYLFIAHDLAVVRNVSDRIAVMYLGKIVEARQQLRVSRTSAAPLHKLAAVGRVRPGDRIVGSRPHRAPWGSAESAQAAARLPVPHTLSDRARVQPGTYRVRCRGSAARRLPPWPFRGVSLRWTVKLCLPIKWR